MIWQLRDHAQDMVGTGCPVTGERVGPMLRAMFATESCLQRMDDGQQSIHYGLKSTRILTQGKILQASTTLRA